MTKPQENKELAVVDTDAMLKGNMEGVEPTIQVMKIIHQAQSFKMGDDTKLDSVEGIVLDAHNSRSWWATDFDQGSGDDAPDCFSNDGMVPADSVEEPQASTCAGCPNSKFDEAIHKTPCKKMKQVHILPKGEIMPIRLPLPPSNIRAIDNWIQNLTSKRVPYQFQNVAISLEKAKNKGGIEYSVIAFKNLEVIEDEDGKDGIMKMYNAMLPLMRREVAHDE